jgi:uncharacterized protein (DUF1697 family)
MITYIALLRGINVSGKNKIKMVDLKQLLLNLGYTDITTYIQSGNVIFKSNIKDKVVIEKTIISAITNHFNLTIKVLIITKSELNTIFNSNPFLNNDASIDSSKLHVTILDKKPNFETILNLETFKNNSNDEFKFVNNIIYLYCPNGYGKTKLTNNLFENKLKIAATTRNWKTITKLFELSNL